MDVSEENVNIPKQVSFPLFLLTDIHHAILLLACTRACVVPSFNTSLMYLSPLSRIIAKGSIILSTR